MGSICRFGASAGACGVRERVGQGTRAGEPSAQVSHKGRTALNVDAPALKAHVGHGDLQLPACDFANVFGEGTDTSNVVSADFTGVTYTDHPFVPRADAGGITPACPPGTF